MADEGLRIVNTVDNDQVDRAFTNMRKQIIESAEAAQQQGKKIDEAIDRVALSASTTSRQLEKSINEVWSNVNKLSHKILSQKEVVKEVQFDVRNLTEEYKKAKKNGTLAANSKLIELNAAKKALEEEKASLFSLNQERAKENLHLKELKKQLEVVNKANEENADTLNKATKATEDNVLTLGMLKKGLAAIGGTMAIKSFVSQIVQTRGEFQQLEVAFTTMLGSAQQADSLMKQLVRTAAITPFDLKGVADGAKQLLAYGVAADEVNDTLIHLGDIAAGLSLPLGDLVYLYGTTMTQGRMFTQDLRQFMGRGIPLAEELAKQFGVTTDKVGELVTAGKVGAKEFKAAIISMSAEGGKFGGLMKEQSKTITGQISNIEDAIDTAFNEMGQKSEGLINTSLDSVSYLVENYEKVGKVILSVAGVYGTYKAAVLAVIAVEKVMALARLAHIKQITLCQLATDILTKKMALLNSTMLMNPWVLAATGIAACIAVMVNMETETDRLRKANEDYNNTLNETIKQEEEHKRRIDELISVASDESLATDTRRQALQKLNKEYPQIFAKYKTEAEWLEHIRDIKAEIAELDGKTSHKKASVQKQDVDKRIAELEKKGKATYQVSASHDQAVTIQTGGRTAKEEAELKTLYSKRKQLSAQIQKDKGDEYMRNLTGVSNATLDRQINERKNILAKMKVNKNAFYGKVSYGGAQGVYSKKELEAQLNSLTAEKNRRSSLITPSGLRAKLEESLSKAQKKLADFDKSKKKYSPDEAEKKRKELKDAVDDAEKKLKAAGGDPKGTEARKAAAEAKKNTIANQKGEKYSDIVKKQELAQKRADEDAELDRRQAELDAQKESSEKTITQYKLDFDKQKIAIERGYEDLKQKKIDKARELFSANPANAEKTFDPSSVDTSYTEAEKAAYEAKLKANKYAYDENMKSIQKEEIASLYEFLEEYGDIEQKKLAITEDYERRISEAKTTGEKAALSMERDKAIKDAESADLSSSIDWSGVFSDLKGHTKEYLQGLRDQLQELLNSGSLPVDQLETVSLKIRDIDDELGKQQSLWNFVGDKQREYNRLLQESVDAEERRKKAIADEGEAQYGLSSIKEQIGTVLSGVGINVDSIDSASLAKLDKSSGAYITVADKMSPLLLSLVLAESKLADARKKTKKATEDAKNAEDKTKLSSSQKVADWFADAEQFIAKKGIDQIPDLLNSLGLDSVGDFASKGLAGFNSAAGAANDFANHNYIGAAVKALDSVKNFGQALLGGSNVASMEEKIAELGAVNDRLAEAVSDLSQSINKSDSTNQQSLETYKAAVSAEKEWEQNQRERIKARAKEYSNSGHGFLGLEGKKSFNHYVNSGFSRNNFWDKIKAKLGIPQSSGWDDFNKVLATYGNTDQRVYSAQDLWNLSPEMMKLLRDYAPAAWNKLLSSGGEANPSDLINEYIQNAGKLEELTSSLNEKLTGYSWDGFLSSYKDTLKDLESDTEDFADKIHELISNAMLESLINDEFNNRIKALYKYIADHSADGLDKDEINYINGENEKIAQDMLNRRQDLIDAGLIQSSSSYKQEASKGGWQSMGQDTADELNGRFTALQIAAYDIKDLAIARNEMLARLEQSQGVMKTSVDGITDALALSNIHLADISKYTKHLIAIEEVLGDIKNNTKKL